MRFWLTLIVTVAQSLTVAASEYVLVGDWARKEPLSWDRARAATQSLRFDPGLSCSSVRIGPAGESLTNLHCLEACLLQAGAVRSEPLGDTGFTLHRPTPAARGLRCKVRLGKPLRDDEVEILWVASPGWLSPREKSQELLLDHPELFQRLLGEGFEARGDLALIRRPDDAPCVPMGAKALGPEGKQSVVNLGFPFLFRRDPENPFNTLMTMGTTMMASRGEITDRIDVIAAGFRHPELSRILPFMLPTGILMSSTDCESGASGSPIFDESRRVIGISRSTWKGADNGYQAWATQLVDLDAHRAEIESLVPQRTSCTPE